MRFSREGIGGDQRTILRGRQGGGGGIVKEGG